METDPSNPNPANPVNPVKTPQIPTKSQLSTLLTHSQEYNHHSSTEDRI